MFTVKFYDFPEFIYAHNFSKKYHQFSNRHYNFLEIVFITQGALLMTLDGIAYNTTAGDCLIVPPGTLASCRVDESHGRHSHLSVGVRCRLEISERDSGQRHPNVFSFSANTLQSLGGHPHFANTFEELIRAYTQSDTGFALSLYLQLCTILQACSDDHPKTSNGIIYARKIKDYIDNNYMTRISVPAIASYLSITPEYASNIFKAATNETIISYANRKKIEKAKKLLQDGGISIQYVASMVGIDNNAYFSRLFKKHEGISPSQFKCSIQREYIGY